MSELRDHLQVLIAFVHPSDFDTGTVKRRLWSQLLHISALLSDPQNVSSYSHVLGT